MSFAYRIRFLCCSVARECGAVLRLRHPSKSYVHLISLCESVGPPSSCGPAALRIPHQLQLSSSLRLRSLPQQQTAHSTGTAATDWSFIALIVSLVRIPVRAGHRPSTVTPLCDSPSFTMVNCTVCNVNLMDARCNNTPRTCYACCTSTATTSPAHISSVSWATPSARRVCWLVWFTLVSSLSLRMDTCTSTTPRPSRSPERACRGRSPATCTRSCTATFRAGQCYPRRQRRYTDCSRSAAPA